MKSDVKDISQIVVTTALSWIGTPYRHQGRRKGVGCDCLGLILGVWSSLYSKEVDKPEPYSRDWAETGGEDRFLDELKRYFIECAADELLPGRLILFRWRPHLTAKHAGILISKTSFLHAYEGHGVVSSALIPLWRRKIAGIFAFPPHL